MTINKGGENRQQSPSDLATRPAIGIGEPIEDMEKRMIAAQQATDAALGTVYGPHCLGTLPSGRACRKLLAIIVSAPWIIECSRCGYRNSN